MDTLLIFRAAFSRNLSFSVSLRFENDSVFCPVVAVVGACMEAVAYAVHLGVHLVPKLTFFSK